MVRKTNAIVLKLLDNPSYILVPINWSDGADGVTHARFLVVVVGLATQPKVEPLKCGILKHMKLREQMFVTEELKHQSKIPTLKILL